MESIRLSSFAVQLCRIVYNHRTSAGVGDGKQPFYVDISPKESSCISIRDSHSVYGAVDLGPRCQPSSSHYTLCGSLLVWLCVVCIAVLLAATAMLLQSVSTLSVGDD